MYVWVVLALLAACDDASQQEAKGGPPPVAVGLSSVRREPITEIVDLVGQLEAEETVTVKSETEGTVISVEFSEGSRVSVGDLLFRLRDDEQKARLREADAARELARSDHERAQALHPRRVISDSELESAKARREQAAATRDLAVVDLQRTEIRAPFDGVLGARLVAPGDRVDRDVGLVEIQSVDRLRLVFAIPEIGMALARKGGKLTLSVAPYPDQTFEGEVYFVDPALNPQTRRLLVKAWVPNQDGLLRPGLFANIRVQIAHHEDALTVPEASLAYDTHGPHVWRVGHDETVERVAVELGIRRDGRVEITGTSLSEGDRIVSAGTHKVFAGARVRAAEPPPPPVP